MICAEALYKKIHLGPAVLSTSGTYTKMVLNLLPCQRNFLWQIFVALETIQSAGTQRGLALRVGDERHSRTNYWLNVYHTPSTRITVLSFFNIHFALCQRIVQKGPGAHCGVTILVTISPVCCSLCVK